MNKPKILSILMIVLYGLTACSQKPVVTFEILQTPTPAVSATPWVAGTEQALASPTPPAPDSDALPTFAFTQEVIAKPTDFSPVLYGGKIYDSTFFLLLGGVSRDAWLLPDESVARFSGEVTYSLNTLTQESKYFLWGKAPEFSRTCQVYTVGTDADPGEAGFVAVVDGWDVTKREVTELSADGQFYQQAVLSWLEKEGVNAPAIDVLQIFHVDLEGDGTDEIFISATHLDDSQHTTKAGDYSVVLMRKVTGYDAETFLITGDVYGSKQSEITYPRTYSIANFVDLNQDGILEVVVGFQKWEGFGARIYQIDDQAVTEVLQAGC